MSPLATNGVAGMAARLLVVVLLFVVIAFLLFWVTETEMEHFGDFPQRHLATVFHVRATQFLKFGCSPGVSAKSGTRSKSTNTTNNATNIGRVESRRIAGS